MAVGSLDTASAAPARRLELQHLLSSFSLNDWIFSDVDARARERWLDLGCGRGERSLSLAGLLGPDGAVTSVDLSEEKSETAFWAIPGQVMSISDEHLGVATDDGVLRATSATADAGINTKALINSIRLRLS